jgi:hypothetical protein
MGKQSIVLQLQIMATEKAHDISDLLRTALLVATKLGLGEFKQWIELELNGYGIHAEVPDYRKARAELKLKNPYHGLIPIYISDSETTDALCNVELRDPIENLQSLATSLTKESSYINVPLSYEQEAFLLESQGDRGQLPPVRKLSPNKASMVIDAVRTRILTWSLELESQGILGNGIVFSKEEKEKATSTQSINIHNFQGVLGNVSKSSLKQDLTMSVGQGDIEDLIRKLSKQGVQKDDLADLREAVSLEPRIAPDGSLGQRISDWIGKMASKALSGAWPIGKSIGVGTASKLLSEAIMSYYGLK